MSFLDNIKKKAETLAAEAGKIADKTISDVGGWTSNTVKDVGEWTTQTAQAIGDWTSNTLNDVGDFAAETWESKDKYFTDLKTWTSEMPEKLKDYTDNFNIEDFWNKIAEISKGIGQNLIFMALTCFYALSDLFKTNDAENPNTANSNLKIRVKAKAQNKCALGAVHAYLMLYPDTNLENLKKKFPNSLAPDKGMEELFVTEDEAEVLNEKMQLYFNDDEELLRLSDGKSVALSTMWTSDSLERIKSHSVQYGIEIIKVGLSPNSKGYEIEMINPQN